MTGKNEISTMGYPPSTTSFSTNWGPIGVVVQGHTTIAANRMSSLFSGFTGNITPELADKYKHSGIPKRPTSFLGASDPSSLADDFILDKKSFNPRLVGGNEFIVANWRPVGIVLALDVRDALFKQALGEETKFMTRADAEAIVSVVESSGLPIYSDWDEDEINMWRDRVRGQQSAEASQPQPPVTEAQLRTVVRSILLREELDAEQSNNSPGTKRKIYILVGPPSVGKSTWISRTFKDSQPYIISRDDIAEEVAERMGWTYDDMFHAPPKDAQLGDVHPQFGEVVPSPKYMTWQPLSYAGVSAANREIGGAFGARVAGAADSGQDIVVDMTNMNAGARKSALAAIKGREDEFERIAVVFPFQGAEDAVQRVAQIRADRARAQGRSKTVPPAAIARMMQAYEPVTPEEGFDAVIEFDNRAALRALAER
jgi:hypothetical protein